MPTSLHDAGYSVLLFDLRSSGESEGDAVTFGFRERGDVQGAVRYLKERWDADGENVGALGLSHGRSGSHHGRCRYSGDQGCGLRVLFPERQQCRRQQASSTS